MFGNNKPFGTASAFGGGTFGSTTTPFGQPAGATTFGAKPATGNVFGSSTFGTAAPASGGLFGNPAPTSATGLFGQTSTAFGQPASSSGGSFGFGGTSTSGGLFGTTTPATQSSGLFGGSSTSAFGSPRPAFGGFGGTTTGTGLFGQSTSTGTGLFGPSSGFAAAPTSGTTIKFNPPTGSDTMMKGGVTQNINTRHQCITCMKEYENKSLEELRLEDYAANRKGAQSGIVGFGTPTANTGGLFGAPAASTSGFSFGTTQSKPLFGTTSGTNTFGTTGTGLFGQTSQPQNTAIFGKPVGFGTATTSAAPSFSFGNTSGGSLFGQNNQQKPLFGQQTTGTGLFGQSTTTQPSTGFSTGTGFGGFGATSQPSTGLFGAKPTGFGTTSTATTNTFSFGTPSANTGGLFGQKPAAPAFGANTGFGTGSTFGSFGATQTANTGLFGQKPAGTGFGTTSTGFGSTLGSGFGASPFTSMGMNTNTGTGLFGSSLTNKQPGFNFGGTGTTGFGFGQPNSTGLNFNFGSNPTPVVGSDMNSATILQQQLQAQQVFAFTANPFGDNPLFRNSIKDSKRREELLKPTNPAAQKAVLTNNRYKVSPLPATKIKPKPLTPISSGKVSLFDGLEDEEPSLGNATFIPKRSVKKLVMKSQANSPSLTVVSNVTSSTNRPTEITFSTSVRIQKTPTRDIGSVGDSSPHSSPLTVDISDQSPMRKSIELPSNRESPNNISIQESPYISRRPLSAAIKASSNPEPSFNDTIEALHTKTIRAPAQSPDSDNRPNDLDASLTTNSSSDNERDVSVSPEYTKPHATGIRLTKPGYYTAPPLDDILHLMDEQGNCFVTNFTVGRVGYGNVVFPGKINVANLNLDEIVSFRHKEITVYPDDDNKPPVGDELNRKAEITLECVWPMDKTSHSPIKDPTRLSLMGYVDKIKKSTARLGAKFIDYKPETGSWIFEVEHFSKYGLEDSDDECDDPKLDQASKAKPLDPSKKVQPVNGERADAATTKQAQVPKKLRSTAVDDDDEMQDADVIAQSENIFSPLQQLVTAGVDSERIQGMKASFFLNEVEDNWVDSEVEMQEPIPRFGSMKSQGHFLKPVPIKKPIVEPTEISYGKKSFDFLEPPSAPTVTSTAILDYGKQNAKVTSSITAAREEIWSAFPVISPLTLALTPAPYCKILATAGRKISLRPFSKSLMYDKQKCLSDIGYFMGRRFRVGWGPGFKILHLGQVQGNSDLDNSAMECSVFSTLFLSRKNGSLGYNPFTVSISKLCVLAELEVDHTIKENLIQSLLVQLENSESTIEDESPVFVPKHGIKTLHAHASLSEKQLLNMDSSHCDSPFVKQCNHVWELCVALWGEIPGLESNQTASAYVEQMARREALSNWLIKTSKEKVLSEINNNSFDPASHLSVIFSYLSGRQISKAVHFAQESNEHCLATLLAQAEGNAIFRRLISKQLLNWEQSGACNFINCQRLKLYALLAGVMVWRPKQLVINCCEHIDWRRALALHLWYYCFPTSGIQDAVANFEMSFLNSDSSACYAQPPLPPYMQSMEDVVLDNSSLSIYDTCFHLLKLYCDRSYRLDKLLMPEGSTSAHTDYRLSWLLHQSLLALGYCHLPITAACALHLDFSSQLEAMGLWQWAVFVVLHLPDSQMRAKYVKDLLLRHLSLEHSDENDEKELFLQEKLLVPEEWIFEAKAIKACSFGQPADEAWYLLKAGHWSKSHEIVVSQLASDAIINENYEYLLNFLKELAPVERSETILDWASGGQVFLDYIHVSQMVESVVKGEVSAYDVEKLQPEVVSLCHRLSSIQCCSAKDRLCQSEMSKKTATLLRAVCTLQAERSGSVLSTYTLMPHIKSLPMPEDYALQELRAVARNYLKVVASE